MAVEIISCFEHQTPTKEELYGLDLGLVSFSAFDFQKTSFQKFMGWGSGPCIVKNNDSIETSRFIGLDWLVEGTHAIHVKPKLDSNAPETNFFALLRDSLEDAEDALEIDALLWMPEGKQPISIESELDNLTPLLIVRFVTVMQTLVKKGLRKGFYSIKETRQASVRGKVLVSETIKKHTLKQRPIHTECQRSVHGLDTAENQLLKRALKFVGQYLGSPSGKAINIPWVQQKLAFCLPAFEEVSDSAKSGGAQHSGGAAPTNPLFAQHAEAAKLARLILKRFQYSSATSANEEVLTPPYWIDMAKLFELFVLSKLRTAFGKDDVIYQFQAGKRYVDYLVVSRQVVVDAKYKSSYKSKLNIEDVRQIAAYARHKAVIERLGLFKEAEMGNTNCLVIYPDQENGHDYVCKQNFLTLPLDNYWRMYKWALKLPIKVIEKT